MPKIVTFLMFDDAAEEAVALYTSVFKDSKIVNTVRSEGAKGAFRGATFEIAGQTLIAYNGGPSFGFAQGMSLFVNCETQAEVDELWEKLGAGGKELGCGWLADKFGVVWQIIPTVLQPYLADADQARAGRVLQAMLKMKKLDIAGLEAAYRG